MSPSSVLDRHSAHAAAPGGGQGGGRVAPPLVFTKPDSINVPELSSSGNLPSQAEGVRLGGRERKKKVPIEADQPTVLEAKALLEKALEKRKRADQLAAESAKIVRKQNLAGVSAAPAGGGFASGPSPASKVVGGGAKNKLPAASSGAPGLPAVAKYSHDSTAGQAARSAPGAPGHLAALEGALTIYVLSHLSPPGVFQEHPVSYHVSVGKLPPHKVGVPGLLLAQAWVSRGALLQTEEGRRAIRAYRLPALKSLPKSELKKFGVETLACASGRLSVAEILMNLAAYLKEPTLAPEQADAETFIDWRWWDFVTRLLVRNPFAPGVGLLRYDKQAPRFYSSTFAEGLRRQSHPLLDAQLQHSLLSDARQDGRALLKKVKAALAASVKASLKSAAGDGEAPTEEVPASEGRPSLTNPVLRLLSSSEASDMVRDVHAYSCMVAAGVVGEMRGYAPVDLTESPELAKVNSWVKLVQQRLPTKPPVWLTSETKIRDYVLNLCDSLVAAGSYTTLTLFWLKP